MTLESVDFIEAGKGPTVILLHSSVSGARQWRSLMELLAGRFRCVAPNFYGYGATAAWPGPQDQTLLDQAKLLDGLLPPDGAAFSLVGHSFGATVAMKAAARFRGRVQRLVLLEPNPTYLLKRTGRTAAYAEFLALRDLVKEKGGAGDWAAAAAAFADYWTGAGSWAAMPDDRKAKFIAALKPNPHEWDAVLNDEEADLADWAADLPRQTTLVGAADTTPALKAVLGMLRDGCPQWRFESLPEGGHMAPLTRPELVNPIVERALVR